MSRSIIRITVPRLVGNCCGLPSEYLLEMVFTSKWGPEWSPNGSQMAPQRPLGASWPAEGLLERSWRALGALLERSWAVLGGLGAVLGDLGALLDCLGRGLGAVLGLLRRSWSHLWRSWVGLGQPWEDSAEVLGLFWSFFAT